MTHDGDRQSLVDRIDRLQREIYDLRRVLAGRSTVDRVPSEDFDVLLCTMGGERIALRLDSVQEAVRIAKLTTLHEAPPWVPGVLNLRGRLIPVIDFSARVARAERRPSLTEIIVVCRRTEQEIGILVQSILGIHRVSVDSVEPAPEGVALAPYVVAMIRQEETPALLVSVESLAASSDLPESQQ